MPTRDVQPARSAEPDLPRTLLDPKTLCCYSMGDFLGKGGFASCYMAAGTDKQSYALKVVDKTRLRKMAHKEKMKREIHIHSGLRHKNIVRLHSWFEDASHVYMVMELCTGLSLEQRLRERGTLSERETARILAQTLDGVRHLHDVAAILHRDLKVGNLLLTDSGCVKLADFGLAILISELTWTAPSVCGTPNYIAPEVLKRSGHSRSSEMWAIGCIVYALLVGRPPFETDSLESTYARISVCQFAFPRECGISHAAQDLIERILVLEPYKRLTISQILDHPFLVENTAAISPPPFPYIRRETTFDLDAMLKLSMNGSAGSDWMHPDMHGSATTSSSGDSGFDASHFRAHLTRILRGFSSLIHSLTTSSPPRMLVMADVFEPVLFVAKWVDYTNKHGFGCVLSDGTRCILFVDNSAITNSEDGLRYQLVNDVRDGGALLAWTAGQCMPSAAASAVHMLQVFRAYMDRELMNSAETRAAVANSASMVFVVHTRRCNDLLFVLLSDGTVQVNFLQSHHKLVLSWKSVGALLTVIDASRRVSSFWLRGHGDLAPNPWLRDLLASVGHVLDEEIELRFAKRGKHKTTRC